MLTLDTRVLPRNERAEAIVTHMREIAMASHVVLLDPPHAFMSTSSYALGDLQLVHLRRSGLFMDVDRERDDCPATVAMMLGSQSRGTREQFGHVIEQRPGVVDMIELHRPHKAWSDGRRNGWVLKLPVEALGLPADAVSRARPALGASPLQGVLASHLTMLTRVAPDLAHRAAAVDLGYATIVLVRAALSTAAGDDPGAREALQASLWPRIQVFVREHLRDPELSPQVVAAAHHISVRLLYRILADAGVQLEQWVIEERLELARRELWSSAGRRPTIAAVAHSCGFATPSHFSRRFRDRYGMTPREWQRRTT